MTLFVVANWRRSALIRRDETEAKKNTFPLFASPVKTAHMWRKKNPRACQRPPCAQCASVNAVRIGDIGIGCTIISSVALAAAPGSV